MICFNGERNNSRRRERASRTKQLCPEKGEAVQTNDKDKLSQSFDTQIAKIEEVRNNRKIKKILTSLGLTASPSLSLGLLLDSFLCRRAVHLLLVLDLLLEAEAAVLPGLGGVPGSLLFKQIGFENVTHVWI